MSALRLRDRIWPRFRWPIVAVVAPFVPVLLLLAAVVLTAALVGHLVMWALDDLINPENLA